MDQVFSESINSNLKSWFNNKLLAILQFEEYRKPRLYFEMKHSPDGMNHIVVCDDLCFFVNIYGLALLKEDFIFMDGELGIENIQWIERDNLVLFDLYYIVHGDRQKVICHYSNDENSFVYLTALTEDDPTKKLKTV